MHNAMDPITFIAFLIGINSSAPATTRPAEPKKPQAEKQKPAHKEHGTVKRGGWDRN